MLLLGYHHVVRIMRANDTREQKAVSELLLDNAFVEVYVISLQRHLNSMWCKCHCVLLRIRMPLLEGYIGRLLGLHRQHLASLSLPS